MIRVDLFDGSAEVWDAFVRRQAGWTHYHLHGWGEVIRRVHGHRCWHVAAWDEAGVLSGLLPLVEVKSWIFGHYLVSMPFVSFGGPLGTDEAVDALLREAVGRVDRTPTALLEVRSRHELPVGLEVSHRKITVILDLHADGPDAVWRGFESKLRSQIRRSQKAGLAVRFGAEQIDAFYALYARRLRDLGTPPQPRRLFETVAEVFQESAVFGCGYLDGEPVAAGAGFRWGDEFEITWAAASTDHSRSAPNMGLYWAFIEWASQHGVRSFHFGRCTPGGGTHRFKQQWGGRDHPLWWYHYGKGGRSSTPSPDDSAFSWGPRVWRHLPLAIATALGPRLVRYLP